MNQLLEEQSLTVNSSISSSSTSKAECLGGGAEATPCSDLEKVTDRDYSVFLNLNGRNM